MHMHMHMYMSHDVMITHMAIWVRKTVYHIWQARDREKVIKYIYTLCPGEEVLLATLT